ncbi:MAG: ATP synthase F1 subunit gamma [Bacteroidaceae bacterium]|nr:ATP synthase F1 subunit gamma [Bacteroidaceae bacterium]
MKLVSSAKLHKAQMAIENLQPYSQRLDGIVSALMQANISVDKVQVDKLTRAYDTNPSSTRQLVNSSTELKRVALVAISSSASLCGGFNNNLIRLTQHVIDEYTGLGSNILLIPIGRKVAQALAVNKNSVNLSTESDYVSIGEKPTYAEAAALATHLTELYLTGQVDRVEILYTHYKNMAVQTLTRKQFLPFFNEERRVKNEESNRKATPSSALPVEASLLHSNTPEGRVESKEGLENADSSLFTLHSSFILEPSAPELLSTLLPQALAMRLYAILLDSSAAEHAARTFAMQTATDNGEALLQELNLQYNKGRQQAITNELLDIVGGQMRR